MEIKKKTKYIAVFFAIWISIHLFVMLLIGLTNNINQADAILIFGNKVETSGEPSKRLKSRLDEGIELFKQNKAPLIIVSGGFGKEGYDEALVMKEYLIENSIPESAIITDQNGNNTYQTAKNLAKIKKDENIKSIILVSQYYHLLRAKLAVSKFGFDTIYLSYAKMFPELRDLYSIPREIVGYYFYLFNNYES